MDTIRGPNSFTSQHHSVSGMPSSSQWCAAIRWTSVAATTAQPAGKTQWMALKVLQAYSVFGPMPPLPTMTFTPVCSTNSFSNFSIRIEVVGPTETIS